MNEKAIVDTLKGILGALAALVALSDIPHDGYYSYLISAISDLLRLGNIYLPEKSLADEKFADYLAKAVGELADTPTGTDKGANLIGTVANLVKLGIPMTPDMQTLLERGAMIEIQRNRQPVYQNWCREALHWPLYQEYPAGWYLLSEVERVLAEAGD